MSGLNGIRSFEFQSLMTATGPVIIAVRDFCRRVLHTVYHCYIVFASGSVAESIVENIVPEKNNRNASSTSSSSRKFSAMMVMVTVQFVRTPPLHQMHKMHEALQKSSVSGIVKN